MNAPQRTIKKVNIYSYFKNHCYSFSVFIRIKFCVASCIIISFHSIFKPEI